MMIKERFKLLLLVLAVTVMSVSCGNDDDTEYYFIRAADGKLLRVSSLSVTQYNSESAFISAVGDVNPYPDANGDNYMRSSSVELVRDTVYGSNRTYDLRDVWQQVRFGEWARAYGLSTDRTYLVNYQRVTKYLPCAYDENILAIPYDTDDRSFMGIINGSVGYELADDNINDGGKLDAYTVVAYIGYDSEGAVVDRYYPCRPEDMLWDFGILKIGDDFWNQ